MKILDLDNCIADDSWRICLIDRNAPDVNTRYHAYHLAAEHDTPGNLDLIAGREDISIFTARPLQFRAATERWLKRNNVPYRNLIMRNNHDHRPSADLKSMQLQWLLTEYGVRKEDISCAYDDRPDVIEMYRTLHGIRAERRFIHTMPYIPYVP